VHGHQPSQRESEQALSEEVTNLAIEDLDFAGVVGEIEALKL
jgi:hypothetical protein